MFNHRILRVPNRENLWDSSSDDDVKQEQRERQQSNIEMIDLTDSPERIVDDTVKTRRTTATATATTPTSTLRSASSRQEYSGYVSSTLQPNSPRLSILPAFPTSIYDERQPPPLLLANVPRRFLFDRLLRPK